MGFDANRFVGEVDEELFCAICRCVLESPVQAIGCEHAFCRSCIEEWLTQNSTCPVDRLALSVENLGPVPRILKNLLGRLIISCDYSVLGCPLSVRLDALEQHLLECEFNPSRTIVCSQGCDLLIPARELPNHSCIRDLRVAFERQARRIDDLERVVSDQAAECQILREAIVGLSNLPSIPPCFVVGQSMTLDATTEAALNRWSQSLPVAKIARWGGLISTPDAVLQAVIKRSLQDMGCPLAALAVLMQRAHERNWPSGLQSLEVRQEHRRQYERYVCKRIPNKQAVIVLACDNQHMPLELYMEPGIVLIFAHGVE